MITILSKYRLQAAKVPFRSLVKGLVNRITSVRGLELSNPYKVVFEKVDQEKAYFSYIIDTNDYFSQSREWWGVPGSEFDNAYNEEIKVAKESLAKHIAEVKQKLGLPSGLKLKPMRGSMIKSFIKRNKASGTALIGVSDKDPMIKDIGPFYIENFELENGVKLTWIVSISTPEFGKFSSLKGYIELTGSAVANKTSQFVNFPDVTVGTIFVTTFGYNMTLYEYYEVVKRDEQYVYVKRLEKKVLKQENVGEMLVAPIPGDYNDGTVYKAKLLGTDTPYIKAPELTGHTASVWDGKPYWENHWD